MAVSQEQGDSVDYKYLEEEQGKKAKGRDEMTKKWTKRVSFEKPLEVAIDGLSNRAVVMKPEHSLSAFVQANAFLDLETNLLRSKL